MFGGVVDDSSFSSFVRTMHNADLNDMVINAGLSLGADTDDGTLENVQLRFGLLNDTTDSHTNDKNAKHVTFGLKDSVTPLKKGDNRY